MGKSRVGEDHIFVNERSFKFVININAINNGNWLIMQLIKDKNKIRWNQTGKLITDPTLDFFNKRLNVQFLNKKFGKHFQKSMISKASKIETL